MLRILSLGATCTVAFSLIAGSATAITVGGLTFAEPRSDLNGRALNDVAINWWKFAVETPVDSNPSFGAPYEPGPLAGEGTNFLYADQTGLGTLESRVAPGQSLFLPLRPVVNIATEPTETAADLLAQIEPIVQSTTDLTVTVNGVDFEAVSGRDLLTFRETYPGPGDPNVGVQFPDSGSVFGPGFDGFASDIMVADGQYLGIISLPRGEHELVVSASFEGGGGYTVTQNVEVVPLPAPLALLAGGLVLLVGLARRGRFRHQTA